MQLPQLSVAQRLWFGLLLLLGLFAIADLVSLDAARDVDRTLNEILLPGDERRGVGYEMRTNLSALAERVDAYVEQGSARERASIEKTRADFKDSLDRYTDLARTEAGRQLAQKVSTEYERLLPTVAELVKLQSTRTATRATSAALQGEIKHILTLRADTVGRASPDGAQDARAEIEREMLETAALLRAGRQIDASERAARRDRFLKAVGRNRSPSLSAGDRAWLDSVQRWHLRATKALRTISEVEIEQERLRGHFAERVASLDALLADAVQPAARADILASVAHASSIAHEANAVITRSLIIAFLLGAAVSWATVRAVRAPLRKVVSSSQALAAGDFSKRVDWHSRDELGELADAFNSMANRLQSTMVSRTYLESVVNSMTEALIVISSNGTIQTVNPAAKRLLGYEEAELIGAALHRLSSTPETLLCALQGSQLLEQHAMLCHKDGTELPILLSATRLTIAERRGSSAGVHRPGPAAAHCRRVAPAADSGGFREHARRPCPNRREDGTCARQSGVSSDHRIRRKRSARVPCAAALRGLGGIERQKHAPRSDRGWLLAGRARAEAQRFAGASGLGERKCGAGPARHSAQLCLRGDGHQRDEGSGAETR